MLAILGVNGSFFHHLTIRSPRDAKFSDGDGEGNDVTEPPVIIIAVTIKGSLTNINNGMTNKHPPALVAIVFYKVFVATLLTITGIALLLTLKNYQNLENFSQSYELEAKHRIINWFLDNLLKVNPKTLKFSGIGSGIYAIITAIEAVGLWYEKAWARFLVLGLVGLSIPLEIFELIQGITFLKSVILLINVGIFWYLLRYFPKHKH